MKYNLIEGGSFLIIEISGTSEKNEILFANKALSPYLKKKGNKTIVDLKAIEIFDPVILTGILSGIRKKTDLLGKDLRLCSLGPEILAYFKQNRLDEIFHIYDNKEQAKEGPAGE